MDLYFPLYALSVIGVLMIFLQTLREHHQRSLDRLVYSRTPVTERVTVIIPLKGSDPGLLENAKSVFNQTPKPVQVIYAVEDVELGIKEALRGLGDELIPAHEVECEGCSGKVRAILSGIGHAKGEILIFVDSDTRLPQGWLEAMVKKLREYDAVTTYSWPQGTRTSLRNYLREGFWTLGFESMAFPRSRFLWGGGMGFRREVVEKALPILREAVCDDCTMTRYIKEVLGGIIGFLWYPIPLNLFDETSLLPWMRRQIITVRVYSPRGAKAFLVVSSLLWIFALVSILHPNPLTPLPFMAWWVKNLLRGSQYGLKSISPSTFSLLMVLMSLPLMVMSWGKREVVWRGKRYLMEG